MYADPSPVYLSDFLSGSRVGLQFRQDGLGLFQDGIHLVPHSCLGFCGLCIYIQTHPERQHSEGALPNRDVILVPTQGGHGKSVGLGGAGDEGRGKVPKTSISKPNIVRGVDGTAT